MKTYCLLLFTIIILASCSPTKTVIDTSCPGYRKTDFKRENISDHGIGIMPVLGGEEKEQFRRPMGEAITKYFRIEFDKVQSPDQVINILNEYNLVGEYTTALNKYG
jgi:hypothetical protein